MAPEEFLTEIMAYFDQDLDQEQIRLWTSKLETFNGHQLERLLNRVYETQKRFPRLAHVYGLAEDLGYQTVGKGKSESIEPPSEWSQTDCHLCHGCGHLQVFFQVMGVKENLKLVSRRQLLEIRPLWGPLADNSERPAPEGGGVYEYWFRCSCDRGTRKGSMSGWPQWSSSQNEVREVTDLDPHPKMKDGWKKVSLPGIDRMQQAAGERENDEIPF